MLQLPASYFIYLLTVFREEEEEEAPISIVLVKWLPHIVWIRLVTWWKRMAFLWVSRRMAREKPADVIILPSGGGLQDMTQISFRFRRYKAKTEVNNSLVDADIRVLPSFIYIKKGKTEFVFSEDILYLHLSLPPGADGGTLALYLGHSAFIYSLRRGALGRYCSCQWVHTCSPQQPCTASFLSVY